jgi:hypothetical protein
MKAINQKRHIHIVVPPVLAEAIDQWRLKTQHLGSRPDAIRKILERVLLDAKGKAVA